MIIKSTMTGMDCIQLINFNKYKILSCWKQGPARTEDYIAGAVDCKMTFVSNVSSLYGRNIKYPNTVPVVTIQNIG